jgi:hypothetical protein
MYIEAATGLPIAAPNGGGAAHDGSKGREAEDHKEIPDRNSSSDRSGEDGNHIACTVRFCRPLNVVATTSSAYRR